MFNKKSVWITWENQIRNVSMSSRLSADYHPIIYSGNRLFRYLYCSVKTISLLSECKNKIVYAQNPSVVLAAITVFFRFLFGYKVVIDAHNTGIHHSNWIVQKLCDFINGSADCVIVTNEGLAEFVKGLGGKPIILPDPLPAFDALKDFNITINHPSVFVISSWAEDEPVHEIFKVAEELPHINFYISGKPKEHVLRGITARPENIHMTGYIPHEQYVEYLVGSNLLVDLTLKDDCLVCGAYEAISLSKPILLSDTLALRHYFGEYAQFTQNTAESISQNIMRIFDKIDYINKSCETESKKFEMRWITLFEKAKPSILDLEKLI
jgi:hypothetical protein